LVGASLKTLNIPQNGFGPGIRLRIGGRLGRGAATGGQEHGEQKAYRIIWKSHHRKLRNYRQPKQLRKDAGGKNLAIAPVMP
jgi:hypothetical protein